MSIKDKWRDKMIKVWELREQIEELKKECEEKQSLLNSQDKIISDLRQKVSSFSLVMSSRLRREIETLRSSTSYTEKEKKIMISTMEYCISAISCEEISET